LSTSSANASLSRRAAERVVTAAVDDGRLERAAAEELGDDLQAPGVLEVLLEGAGESKRRGKGDVVSVSRNLFIPLTNLCRDRCSYCTFAQLAATAVRTAPSPSCPSPPGPGPTTWKR
jgi:2-iminoacetate synthase ThiH